MRSAQRDRNPEPNGRADQRVGDVATAHRDEPRAVTRRPTHTYAYRGVVIPIRDGLFTLDVGGDPVLVGGFSPSSGRYHFPRAPVCPYSGADDVESVELSTSGRLYSWTAVTAAPPGYEGAVPYGLGVVELAEGLRVVGRLTDADPSRLSEGQPMRLVAEMIGTDEDGGELATWAFAPEPPARGV